MDGALGRVSHLMRALDRYYGWRRDSYRECGRHGRHGDVTYRSDHRRYPVCDFDGWWRW